MLSIRRAELIQTIDEEPRLRWLRVGATGFALMFALLIVWGWTWNFKIPNFTDYLSYWAAGRLTLLGDPAAAYDVVLSKMHQTSEPASEAARNPAAIRSSCSAE